MCSFNDWCLQFSALFDIINVLFSLAKDSTTIAMCDGEDPTHMDEEGNEEIDIMHDCNVVLQGANKVDAISQDEAEMNVQRHMSFLLLWLLLLIELLSIFVASRAFPKGLFPGVAL